jgi:hypothetical protein
MEDASTLQNSLQASMKPEQQLKIAPITQLQRPGHLLAGTIDEFATNIALDIVRVQGYRSEEGRLERLLAQHVHQGVQQWPAHLVILEIVCDITTKCCCLILRPKTADERRLFAYEYDVAAKARCDWFFVAWALLSAVVALVIIVL